MTWWLWTIIGIAAWSAIAVGFAILAGRSVSLADDIERDRHAGRPVVPPVRPRHTRARDRVAA